MKSRAFFSAGPGRLRMSRGMLNELAPRTEAVA